MGDFLSDSGVAAITLSYRGDKTGGDTLLYYSCGTFCNITTMLYTNAAIPVRTQLMLILTSNVAIYNFGSLETYERC